MFGVVLLLLLAVMVRAAAVRTYQSGLPSIYPGTGNPKYCNTVGAMSMIDGSLVLIGRLVISTPAVVAKS